MITILRVHRCVLRVSVFLCLLLNVSGCCLCGWDLEDLFDVSPIISCTKSLLEDLFKPHTLGKELGFFLHSVYAYIVLLQVHFKDKYMYFCESRY